MYITWCFPKLVIQWQLYCIHEGFREQSSWSCISIRSTIFFTNPACYLVALSWWRHWWRLWIEKGWSFPSQDYIVLFMYPRHFHFGAPSFIKKLKLRVTTASYKNKYIPYWIHYCMFIIIYNLFLFKFFSSF